MEGMPTNGTPLSSPMRNLSLTDQYYSLTYPLLIPSEWSRKYNNIWLQEMVYSSSSGLEERIQFVSCNKGFTTAEE